MLFAVSTTDSFIAFLHNSGLGNGVPHSSLCPPASTLKINPWTFLNTLILSAQFLIWDLFSQITVGYIKLTIKASQDKLEKKNFWKIKIPLGIPTCFLTTGNIFCCCFSVSYFFFIFKTYLILHRLASDSLDTRGKVTLNPLFSTFQILKIHDFNPKCTMDNVFFYQTKKKGLHFNNKRSFPRVIIRKYNIKKWSYIPVISRRQSYSCCLGPQHASMTSQQSNCLYNICNAMQLACQHEWESFTRTVKTIGGCWRRTTQLSSVIISRS